MTDGEPGSLQAPERNKYFSGELLGAADFQREQTYGIDQRRLLSRLSVGVGVLRGLAVTVAADGTLDIEPGVALDAFGRLIVVPTACTGIDPAQPTDESRPSSGGRLADSVVTVYLSYAELDGDPTPGGPSTTVETYRVIVRTGLPAERFDADEALVVLATVTLPQERRLQSIDVRSDRVEILSNRELLDVITDLEDRIAQLAARLTGDVTNNPSSPRSRPKLFRWKSR